MKFNLEMDEKRTYGEKSNAQEKLQTNEKP